MEHIRLLAQNDHGRGDPALSGYLAWREWAETQYKAGLRQDQCGRCGQWKFPQELASPVDRNTLQSKQGPVEGTTRVCQCCARV
jgi:hypothetical protein